MRRWKSETYNLYKYLSITDNIQIRRTEWAGHHNKMELSQKKVLNWKLHNTRPVGKPTKKWEDVIQRETSQILGIKGWRRTARTQSRMEVSTEGGQGTAGVGGPQMDG